MIPVIVIALVLLATATWALTRAIGRRGIRVRIPKHELQRHVDEALPVSGSFPGIEYGLTRLTIDPRPDGRLGLIAILAGKAAGVEMALRVTGNGALAYRSGSFHLADFRVDGIGPAQVPGTPAPDDRPWTGIAGLAVWARDTATPSFLPSRERCEGILAQAVERVPLHTLDVRDRGQRLAKLALRAVRVDGDGLVAELDAGKLARPVLYGVASAAAFTVCLMVAVVSFWFWPASTAPVSHDHDIAGHVVAMGLRHLLTHWLF